MIVISVRILFIIKKFHEITVIFYDDHLAYQTDFYFNILIVTRNGSGRGVIVRSISFISVLSWFAFCFINLHRNA